MKTIVVGFDSRQEAMDALSLGRELAAADEAELHVAVVQPRGGVPFERAVAGAKISEGLDDQLFETAARALEGLGFTRASLDGSLGGRSAARALYEYAEERGADLIVVGSSHRGSWGGSSRAASERACCAALRARLPSRPGDSPAERMNGSRSLASPMTDPRRPNSPCERPSGSPTPWVLSFG